MSAITGFFINPDVKVQYPQTQTISAMTEILSHRGRDGQETYSSEAFALGYRHFDVLGENKPRLQLKFYERYQVTFDGRLYNQTELKTELELLGYSFATNLEAEVLAAAYSAWGADSLQRLNGVWAFVLVDQQEQMVFMARDRFGVRPLYYYQADNLFAFASEVKSLLEHPQISAAPNHTYLENYFKLGAREYLPETAFERVYRLPHASYWLVKLADITTQAPQPIIYWKLEPNTSNEKFCPQKAKQYAETYYRLLKNAVRRQMQLGVSLGVALSGGLDSSSITWLAQEILFEQGNNNSLDTFSSVYPSKGMEDCDESKFINLVAKQLGVNSHQIEPKVDDIPVEHKKMMWAVESPPQNTLMSSWHSFKLISQKNIKVSLEGQGADELLGGYNGYIYNYILRLGIKGFIFEVFSYIKNLRLNRKVAAAIFLYLIQLIFGVTVMNKLFVKKYGYSLDNNLNETLIKSMNSDLVNNYQVDVSASSSWAVELSYPYTDIDLINFVNSIPAVYKIHNGWTKYLARLAFNGKLPDAVVWRSDKMGWEIPENQWFAHELEGWLSDKSKNIPKNSSLKLKIKALNLDVFKELFKMK